ncbi:transcriptional repressor AgaR [Thalassotalea euphylliae]|uniref:DeoR/GlpR transcriptional regulator n=1 Tax=Thalassotalea euphylliae TaxID=1655234 RepID=A0A3E0UBF3_9GAMM|nr:transcriptional repressor AgaR [Thalassotalea euphylliae]REL34338.1 DeoR/GlpR transcriptional regulator [Thalassotalea euphylliae]
MSTLERRQSILSLLQTDGRVEVPALAAQFAVSTVTIRTDLNYLDKKGLLVRSHGGAVASERITKALSQELSIGEKKQQNHAIKEAIGERAAQFVEHGDNLIIDSGTTTLEVAKALFAKENLVVMTNGLNIASELAKHPSSEVMVTGGQLRKKSLSFYGRQAEASLSSYRFNKLFLGVDGFDVATGITTHFEPEAHLNRVMCQANVEIIAVADSSKFSKQGLHIICDVADIDVLITDSKLSQAHQQALIDAGIRLELVEAD